MAERVTRLSAEVLVSPTSSKARVTSENVEVLVQPSPKARVTSENVEVLVAPTSGRARVTSLGAEVLIQVVVVTDVSVALINQAAATFAPTVSATNQISVGLIDRTATTFTPVVASPSAISVGLINQTASTFSPTVSVGAVDLSFGLISQTAATFAPTVSAVGSPASIVLGLIDRKAATFSPSVTSSVSVLLGQISQTASTFAPMVVVGSATISLGLINQAASAFSPTIVVEQFVALPRIVKLAACFSPTVTTANQIVTVGIINRSAVPWPPLVAGSTSSAGTGGGGTVITPRATPTPVVIRYNGTDITADVLLSQAKFTAMVNGSTGAATLRVRDDGHSYAFVSGGTLTVDIGGQRMWGGFVTRASKVYPFSYEDTTNDQIAARYWQLEGVDYNVLFNRRIVFDAAHPASKLSFDYAVGTYDDTIIADLFDHYLDLGDDGLSRSGVERVDIVTPDIKGVTSGKGTLTNGRGQIASAGYTWKQAMDVISRATGAVYYIDPDKVLNYVDVDTPDAPYGLSDAPDGEIGYQDFRLTYNGTQLINDMFVWGTALGSDQVVFSRAQSSTSQSDHGIWQESLVTSGLYKQASANLVSSSYLNGTPQNKRGHKDDAISFSCRVFEPFFRVGQKVSLTNTVFGYSDVLPIRRMDIRFINQSQAVFDLTLSHEIDQPWMIFEQLIPPIGDFNISIPPIYIPDPFPTPPPVEGGCDCGITDTFDRTVSGGWGTSDAGISWDSPYPGGDVSSGVGSVSQVGTGNARKALLLSNILTNVFVSGWTTGITAGSEAFFVVFDNDADVGFEFYGDGTVILYGNAATTTTSVGFTPSSPFNSRIVVTSDTTWDLYLWLVGDPEPGTPTATLTDGTGGFLSISTSLSIGAFGTGFTFFVDSVDIDGVDRCTEFRFDSFNRTVSGGWGTSDYGLPWAVGNPADASSHSVGGGVGQVAHSSGSPEMSATGAGPWTQPIWTMSCLFRVGTLSANPSDFKRDVLRFSIDTGRYLEVGLAADASTSGYIKIDDDATPQLITFTQNAWYVVRWYYEQATGVAKGKVWAVGTTEPDWQTEATTGPGDGAPTTFRHRLFGKNPSSGFTYSHQVDWIDFDYDGKPCYRDCVDQAFTSWDAFGRSVSTGWGTSDAGSTYSYLGISNAPPGSGNRAYVSGGVGVLEIEELSPNIYFGPTVDGDDPGPWHEPVWTFGCKFRTGDWVYGGEGGYEVINLEVGGAQRLAELVTGDNTGHSSPHGLIGTDEEEQDFDWHPLTWYRIKWRYNWTTGDSWLKVWPDGDTEPDWMITLSTYGGAGGDDPATYFRIRCVVNTLGSGASPYVALFDDIEFGVCQDVDSAEESAGGSIVGWTCEQHPTGVLERIDSTHFRTTSYIVAATSEVYVDGYLQRPGIAREYTESTNAEGIIQFADPVSDSSVVKVCYNAAGARVE